MPSRGIVRVGGIQCRRMALQLKASLLAAFAISAVSLAVRALWLIYVMRSDDLRHLAIQAILVLVMNINGIFIYIPTELVQRRTFRETCKSVENRLHLHRYNQKQEKSVFLAKSCLFQIGVIVELVSVQQILAIDRCSKPMAMQITLLWILIALHGRRIGGCAKSMPNMLPMLFCHLFDAIALRFFASVAIRDAQKTIADENYIYRKKIATKMAPLMSPRGIVGQNYIPNELVQRTVASNSCSQQIHLFTTTLTFKLLTPMAWIWSSNCFIKIEAEPITRNPVIVNACQGKKEFDFENIPLPVPEGIRGFSRIQISCLDEKVIRFLVQIKYLFKEGIILGLKNVHQIMPSLFADIWPIIKEDLYALSVDYHGLNFMRQCISNTVLTSCPKLRWIEASDVFPLTFSQ
ncbi:hypothetical protein niasHS_001936 [Heterodera schachtii]|uniref:Adenylate cyclase N-terminal domain-containing protein n=1 Tax=Heterodera schachtii TaxID=97005 RepID=A0ABD2KAQ8_HETSC